MPKRRKSDAPTPTHVDFVPDGPPDAQRQAVVQGECVLRDAIVAPAEWRDPADSSTQARHHGARKVQGWRRVWTIQVLHDGSPREITSAHVRAAERLLGDYELGVDGATQGGMANDKVDGGGGGGISGARLDALRRYREAMGALGSQGALIVTLVVVDNWNVSRLAGALGIGRDRAFGRLQAGLERLREHYWPPRENAAVQVSEDALAEDGEFRAGRWRKV